MFKQERQQQILQILQEKHHCSVEFLAGQLFASAATIRRDVIDMEREGLLHRSYGGVSLPEGASRHAESFEARQTINQAVKAQLARRAAALVHDGDTIMMDSSTTVLEMAPFLSATKNITVITNSLRLTDVLRRNRVRVYCTGGLCSEDSTTLGGSIAETALRGFNADLLFFSCQGISDRGIVSDSSDIATQVRRVMLRQAAQSVLLCDSSKLSRGCLFNLCHVSEIDTVLCEVPLPESWYY